VSAPRAAGRDADALRETLEARRRPPQPNDPRPGTWRDLGGPNVGPVWPAAASLCPDAGFQSAAAPIVAAQGVALRHADGTTPRCLEAATGRAGTPGGCRPPSLRSTWLHLDGRSTRELPYERRRELLLDLALDEPGWRTPRHFVAETRRVVAATRDHGLEGVVAKRLASRYLPGTRNGAWVKHKHRRTESFLVSGWSPAEGRRPESLLLARAGPNGSLEPAGSDPFVLPNGQTDDVRRRLETLVLPPTRRGQRIRRLAPETRAAVAFHGPTRGQVRDPILRAVAPLEPSRSSQRRP
jgi:ATP dependent DNA ligase domain